MWTIREQRVSPNGAGRYGRRCFDRVLTVGDLSSVQDTVNTDPVRLHRLLYTTEAAWAGYPRIWKFVEIITRTLSSSVFLASTKFLFSQGQRWRSIDNKNSKCVIFITRKIHRHNKILVIITKYNRSINVKKLNFNNDSIVLVTLNVVIIYCSSIYSFNNLRIFHIMKFTIY